MIMQLLKYLILFLVLCNMPSYLLTYFGPSMGALGSFASSLSILAFFVLIRKRHPLLLPFVFLGLLYFSIGSLNYTHIDINNYFVKEFIRFMIVVVCGAEVMRRTKKEDIYYILLVGGISILINAFLFPTANGHFGATYGRYSGFYLNPNFAGQICLIGFAISFSISNFSLRLIGQLIFTLSGILTFSRTFILVWVLINVLAIIKSKKNLLLPLVGISMLLLVFTFSDKLTLNTERFYALKSVFGEEQVDTKTIEKDSRDQTWALYYDMILDKPVLGNGYLKLSKKWGRLPGAHNSFLMVWGESGIIPLILMLGIYGYLLFKSYLLFKIRPEMFYISLVITLALMTSHQYFTAFHFVFLSMFVFIQLRNNSLVTNYSKIKNQSA